MIHKLKNSSYRVRYEFGHGQRYRALKSLKEPSKKVLEELLFLEEEYGLPKRITTRRSAYCIHMWQAKEIEEAFRVANKLDAEGRPIPKTLLNFVIAPSKDKYIDEAGFLMASICGFKIPLIDKLDYDLFLSQADINLEWLDSMSISQKHILGSAITHCSIDTNFKLKNKTIIFTGAMCGFTGEEEYVLSLIKLVEECKVDAVITAGTWIKSIFLHKTAGKPKVLPALKLLAKKVKVYALRSSRDKPEHLQLIKDIGVQFINGIEDENHVFTGINLTAGSTKNQLNKFDESHTGKNIFFYTSFVGIKSQATEGGGLRYLVGSGSSGYNTPRARVWSNAYDTQLVHSGIRDSIGGHLLRFDSKGTVYPTTFRFHTDLKGILFGGKAFFRNKIKAGKLHLILSDFHAGSHQPEAFSAILSFIRRHSHNIKSLVLNGDFLDNMVLCHHNRGKFLTQITMAKRDMDFLKEIAYVRECLVLLLKDISPKTKLIFKYGNHEVNSVARFLERDINHFLKSMLDIDVLLNLSKLGFKIIPSKVAYKVCDVTIHHGHEMQRTEARKIFGKNSLRGHSHLLLIDSEGMTVSGMEDKAHTDYLSHKYVPWTTGFAVITEVDNFSVLPQPMLVIGNTYSDFNSLVTEKVLKKVTPPKTIKLEYDLEWTGREELS